MHSVIVLMLFLIENSLQQDSGCLLLRLDAFEYMYQPLILDKNAKDFLYPALSGYNSSIEIPYGDTILFSCPGSQLKVNETVLNSTEYAVCGDEMLFHIGDISFNQLEISCTLPLYQLASLREDPEPCGLNGTLVKIGFEIGIEDKFLTQSSVCFDNEDFLAQYAYYNLTPYVKFADSVIIGAPLALDPYYPDDNLPEMYQSDSLRKNINPLLGLPENSTKYFIDSEGLSARLLTDSRFFLYGAQQFSIYRYINAAPVWGSLVNMNYLNYEIKNYSVNYELNLDIYTGTHGTLTLPHEESGEPIEIYLYGKIGDRVIKVPEIVWSIVYEPNTKRALAMVMHNNLYLDADSVVEYCTDIYDEIQWILLMKQHDPSEGYSYVCSYDDLKSSVPEIPNLEVSGILY